MTDHQPTSLTSLLSSIFQQASSPPAPSSLSSADPTLSLLSLLERADRLASSLSLFSDNDTLDDLPTSTLRALFIHSAWGEVEARVNTRGDHTARRLRLEKSRSHYATFLKTLFELEVLQKSQASEVVSAAATGAASPQKFLASLLLPLVSSEGSSSGSSSSSSSTASTSLPSNPSQRRELKVALFRLEKAFKSALDEYRSAARQKAAVKAGGGLSVPGTGTSTGSTSSAGYQQPEETQWDLLILPRPNKKGNSDDSDDEERDDDDDDDDDDVFVSTSGTTPSSSSSITPPTNLRSYLLLLLQLHALMAYNNLASITDELQLLANIPASAERDARESQAREEAEAERRRRGGVDGSDEFRLDRRFDSNAPGPLMDDKGKPLRPFTITSSNARGGRAAGGAAGGAGSMANLPTHDLDERQRIRQGVFQPSHRLPTMSIDEYLAEEERRGNILRGGGAEGAAQPTPREARAVRAEMDGSREAEEAQEEARREAIEWDAFTESNKRGAGNTMNRG